MSDSQNPPHQTTEDGVVVNPVGWHPGLTDEDLRKISAGAITSDKLANNSTTGSQTTILEGEAFRDFYIRTRGRWPGTPGETLDAVVRRVMDAAADWCDALKERRNGQV